MLLYNWILTASNDYNVKAMWTIEWVKDLSHSLEISDKHITKLRMKKEVPEWILRLFYG